MVNGTSTLGSSQWKTWDWNDNKLAHFVPKGWTFPDKIPLKAIWDLWYFGNADIGIRPYKLINSSVDLISSVQRMKFSRAKKVIKFVEDIIFDKNPNLSRSEGVSKWTMEKNDTLFEAAYSACIHIFYPVSSPVRAIDVCYGTLYNRMTRSKRNNE